MSKRRQSSTAAAVVSITMLILGAIGGYGVSAARDDNDTAAPTENSADAGFARDMSTHHAQAVAMAEAIRQRTTDPDLAILATDIVLTQQHQIGQMRGWLDIWGLNPTSLAPPMAWAGHNADTMPGMATRSQIQTLATLPIDDAEVEFIQLMFAHHVGGIEMAAAAVELATNPQTLRLADAILNGQTAELDVLNDLLRRRGAEPQPRPVLGSQHGGDHAG